MKEIYGNKRKMRMEQSWEIRTMDENRVVRKTRDN